MYSLIPVSFSMSEKFQYLFSQWKTSILKKSRILQSSNREQFAEKLINKKQYGYEFTIMFPATMTSLTRHYAIFETDAKRQLYVIY